MKADLLYALRTLRKNPMFTLVAILSLALGIGANTAIFSIVNAVLLKPLPFEKSGDLFSVFIRIPGIVDNDIPFSAPDVQKFAEWTTVFSDVAAFRTDRYDISSGSTPERTIGCRMSASGFPLLGISPALGRTFTTEEETSAARVVLLGHNLWLSKFASDKGVLGRAISVNRVPYTIIGVMPAGFRFPYRGMKHLEAPEFWVPISFTPTELKYPGDNFNYPVIARRKPGVSSAQTEQDTQRVLNRIRENYPKQYPAAIRLVGSLVPLQDDVSRGVRQPLLVLLGAVALVMLIVCANVANLLLSRASARQGEMAIRLALGASRGRLIRQLLVESAVLVSIGGVLGLVIGAWAKDLLLALTPASLQPAVPVLLDWRVLLFTLGVSIIAALLFGIAPAWLTSVDRPVESLRSAGKGTTAGLARWGSAFVIGEVALSVILLCASALLIRTFLHLRNSDGGFRLQAMSVALILPDSAYNSSTAVKDFHDRLAARLAAIPGTTLVGGASNPPLRGGWTHLATVEGFESVHQTKPPSTNHSIVYGDYFRVMSIPLKEGRYFDSTDRAESQPVVIINETMARSLFAGKSAVGHRMKWGPPSSTDPWKEIVGVVGDVRSRGLDSDAGFQTYDPYDQIYQEGNGVTARRIYFVALTAAPEAFQKEARAAVASLDPQQAVGEIRPFTSIAADSLTARRFNTSLLTAFAGLALALAAMGIFGVLAYRVSRQVREIGVRLALGAAPARVHRMVLRSSATLAAIGIAIGVPCALLLTRVLGNMVYGVSPRDPISLFALPPIVLVVACLAGWLPARRAARIDPIQALRHE